MARHLKAVGPEDAAPDPEWVKDVDDIEMDGARTVYAAGTLDLDGIAGYAARVLAAMADGA